MLNDFLTNDICHHLFFHVHNFRLLLEFLHDLLYLGHVHLSVHIGHGSGDPLHGLGHGILALQSLDFQRHSLEKERMSFKCLTNSI